MTLRMTVDSNDSKTPVSVEQIKKETWERRLREVQSLAGRLQTAPDGSRHFVRFSSSQRIEHYILIASFTTLAVTGLIQSFSHLHLVGLVIQILGDVETVRTIHRLAAALLIFHFIYHLGQILTIWFVKRERGAMWPALRDFRDLMQVVLFNLGLARKRPEFDRFSVEEKIEYWAVMWGTPVMIITGLILWFPSLVTSVFPGVIVPTALAIHAWEAVLATLAILIWHTYHTIIKEKNRSIFTGIMTEEEMQHAHPVEYQRILAAHEYLEQLSSHDDDRQGDRVTIEKALQEAGQKPTH